MSEYRAAIFDLDGTVIDSMYVWEKVDRDFLTERNIPVTKEYTDAVKGMFFETAAQYTIEKYGLKESVDELVNIWLDMAHYEYENNVRAKPYVYEYLNRLKEQGVKIGMATSSNPYLLESVMKKNGLDKYFDTICYTSEVGKNKEYPDIYLYTANKLGIRPEKCAVFEDIPEGISGAKRAGMYTVAVYDKASEENADILKKSADKFIMGFDEILEADIWKETE